MSVVAPSIDRFIARAGELYSLPAVAMKVITLTDNPKVDVRALKACIEFDPALTTRLLRVVNSSLFGLPREVSDLSQALALLGTKPLKLLVLGFSLPDAMFAGVEAAVLGRYWRRALTRAVAAREISHLLHLPDEDEAFIAGLLEDVGILVLVHELKDAYVRFLDRAVEEQSDLSVLEQAALGFTHLELSASLLEHWKMPQAVVSAIRARAEGGTADLSPCATVLRLASAMTSLVVDRRGDALADVLAVGRDQLGFTNERIVALVATLEQKVSQLADVLCLSLPGGASYLEMLAKAQRKLAALAASAAADLVHAECDSRGGESSQSWPEVHDLGHALRHFLNPQATVESQSKPAVVQRGIPSLGATLESQLVATLVTSRASRQPLTLLLVAVDSGKLPLGPSRVLELEQRIAACCRKIDHGHLKCAAAGEGIWAVVLPDCDRNQAAAHAGALVAAVRNQHGHDGNGTGCTISVGAATVALPPANFPVATLLEKASRCLHAAQLCGGNGHKSIEV